MNKQFVANALIFQPVVAFFQPQAKMQLETNDCFLIFLQILHTIDYNIIIDNYINLNIYNNYSICDSEMSFFSKWLCKKMRNEDQRMIFDMSISFRVF